MRPLSSACLNRHAHQALGSGHRHRLDAHAGVQPDLLLAALQHVLVEKLDQPCALRSSLFPLDARVHILRVLAEDHDVHALGMFHRRRHALVVLHRTHAAVEIQNLPQRNIERTNAAAHGRGQRTLDGNSKFADRVHGVVGQPGIELCLGLLPGKHFIPRDTTLALIRFLYRRVEHAHRRLPDVAPRSIAFDKRNDRTVRHLIFSIRIFDLLPVGSVQLHRYKSAPSLPSL